MEFAIILIFATIILSTIAVLLINSLPNAKTFDAAIKTSVDSNPNLLGTYSFRNAHIINMDSSAPNRPVRPDNEEFFDGITAELTNELNDPTLAKKIINIRCAVK